MKSLPIALLLSVAAATSAQAITYTATDIRDTSSVFSTNGTFGSKDGWQSVGVGGVTGLQQSTGGEIDIGETITGSFAQLVNVSSIQLKFLYDGPEFRDVQEVATFTVTYGDSTKETFKFAALYGTAPTGQVSGNYSFVGGLNNAVALTASVDDSATASWSLLNPFGNRAVSSVVFGAGAGVCGNGTCSNQSDYAIRAISVSPVPEPSTYALMLAGLLAVGFMSRRRAAS